MSAAAPVNHAHASGMLFFFLFLVITLGITYWAARRTRSTDEFFAAGRRITAAQNGIALAGDFLAASSFLGVTGIAALTGFDAIFFSVAIMVAWPLILFVLAEPLRSLGKYTFADVIEYRLGRPSIKIYTALATLFSIFSILTFQMAGAGAIIHLLFGLPYALSVVAIGVFMLIYVLFGGMLATTWVQIIKTFLLLGTTIALVFFVLAHFHYDFGAVLGAASARNGLKVLGPRGGVGPLQLFSLGLATTLGVASLPQVLIRFYTVSDAAVARRSMLYATSIIGIALLLFVFMGFGIMAIIGSSAVSAADRGGNMAIPLLAEYFGGSAFLGFVGAVAFATILAAVCGIVLAGSAALAHDFWIGVVRGGQPAPGEEFRVAKLATVVLCIGGVLLAVLVQGQNIFVLSSLSAAISSSTIFPSLVLAIYWRQLTYAGTVAGMLTGLVASLVMIYLSPIVQIAILHHHSAPIALASPAIITIPLAFIVTILVSLATRTGQEEQRYAEVERDMVAGWEQA